MSTFSSLPLLKEIFQKKFTSTENYKKVINITIELILNAIKFANEYIRKPNDPFEIFDDPIGSIRREVVNAFYKKSYYLQYDYDFCLLQIFVVFTEPCVFPQICSNYDTFLFKNLKNCSQQILCEFLELLVMLSIDESAYLNTLSFLKLYINDYSNNTQKNFINKDNWFRDSLKNIIINAFHHPGVLNMKSLKFVLFDRILNYDNEIEDIVQEISFFF